MGVYDISATALMMAKGVHEIGAFFFSVFLAIVFFFCRDLDVSSAKKVLTGTAIGLLVTLAGIAYHIVTLPSGQAPPLPVLIVFSLLTAQAFYVALVKKDDDMVIT